MTALALTHRPKRLKDIVGQNHVVAVLRAMVIKNDVPPVLIFAGASGTGKTSAARILAAALNCLYVNTEGEPCGSCHNCCSIWNSKNKSVTEIDAASSNSLETINKLKQLTYYAHESKWRVIILDEAHSMSNNTFNVLLKALEEPPEFTVFILATTEAFKIPNTIRTRAMQFSFKLIKHEFVLERLQYINKVENLNIDLATLDEIVKHTKGSLRNAVMQLDQANRMGIVKVVEYCDVFGITDFAVDILKAALKRDTASIMLLAGDAISRTGNASLLLTDLTELLRDLIILKSHGVPPCLPSQLKARKELAYVTDSFRLIAAIKILWQYSDKVSTDADQLIAAQIICTLVADVLIPPKPQSAGNLNEEPINRVTEQPPEKPLSLSEMMMKVGIQA